MPDELSRARAVLARLGVRDGPIPAGRGTGSTVFRAGELAVRVARADWWPGEPALLAAVRELGWPVVEPVHVDDAARVTVYPWVTGESLLGDDPPPGLAGQLGALLGRLHGASLPGLPVDDPAPETWLEELTGPAELLSVVQAEVPGPAPSVVPVHADLGAEHLLVAGGGLVAVLDWSDACLADPAVDFARLLRDFGRGFVDEMLSVYPRDRDDGFEARMLFFARCAALEDLAYGEPPYVANARRSLGWLFPTA